ncbi:hypothetical protein B5F55_12665 [Anaerotruncus colihominis]|nr:hypothetical protein B5F55_12665 [Anaerotruncus colihominis]
MCSVLHWRAEYNLNSPAASLRLPWGCFIGAFFVSKDKRTNLVRACLKIEELPSFSQTAGKYKAKKQESFRIPKLFNAAFAAVCRKRQRF